ncbi:MAG: histidine--tRNA ligase [Deltaproteobacteria bacterium]|nr:MAG: histidine--tRNA ligase [Deltaproteobacteria bacterium]
MIQLIRGFKDILPGEVETWQYIEKVARSLFEDFGFREIRIPIMERTELFARSIGEDTDIVEKEMYTFADRKGDLITLRPEATASICRSYIQHKMYADDPVKKFYTIGPMFRRERPQKGRYRQFYQINVEIFGVSSALADAELIFLLKILCERLAVTDVEARINSLGCPQCRPGFKVRLQEYIASVSDRLCPDCNRRKDRNPLRVLDCKVPTCREAMTNAPSILACLCDICDHEFKLLQSALDRLNVPFVLDKQLVRGLDYYTRATFEIQTRSLGAQSAVAGGGRYDALVQLLGGPDTPATGFAIGFDRLAEIVQLNKSDLLRKPDLFIAAMGEKSQTLAFDWICELGAKGLYAEMDFHGRSLKSQMKRAGRLDTPYVLMVGENELEKGFALLRNMSTKDQEDVPLNRLVENISKRIKPSNDSKKKEFENCLTILNR